MKLSRATYATRGEKVRDFMIGLGGWVVINALLWILIALVASVIPGMSGNQMVGTLGDTLFTIVSCVPLILNGAAVLFFAFTRHWIAFGILAGFGLAFVLVLCAGLVFTAICFAAMGGAIK